jgi:GNAT superfamily N-acetyltransferase
MLPTGLVQKRLTPGDVPAALKLSQEPGWNQVAEDWSLMLGPGLTHGVFTEQGRLVASALSVPYGARYAWIAMVLVTAEFRRRGIATDLMRTCVEELLGRGLVPALDATPEGRQVYLPLGFKDVYSITRLFSDEDARPGSPRHETVRPMIEDDLDAVADYDARLCGADRSFILTDLHRRRPEAAFLALQGKEVVGYVLARNGWRSNQIGPLLAETPAIAQNLLAGALGGLSGPVCIDIGDRHKDLRGWLEDLCFKPQFPFIRMIHGRSEPFDDPNRVFIIAGPELG